jgi:hypothetical protein
VAPVRKVVRKGVQGRRKSGKHTSQSTDLVLTEGRRVASTVGDDVTSDALQVKPLELVLHGGGEGEVERVEVLRVRNGQRRGTVVGSGEKKKGRRKRRVSEGTSRRRENGNAR